MADRVDQQLGNYRLVHLLGRGGFAEVYVGEHLRLGTQAAVKVLYARLATPTEVEAFEKEARTIAHLKHPHIVRVFDFDVQDDAPFLVMDYATGGTLRQRHPKGSVLPLTTIVTYVKQVADALQYAHDQRLIHRDIKPENMLLGQRDELFLSDFGIATIAHHTSSQSTQAMAGTVPYMAPEQIQGKPRPASDQYALGIIVYEWLSGSRPFNGTATEIAMQHMLAPVPSLRENGHAISPQVEQVVITALAKDYKQRFSSVQEFANALEQASPATMAPLFHAPLIVPPSDQASRTPQLASSTGQLAPSTELAMQSPPMVPSTGTQAPSNQTLESTGEWTSAGKVPSSANGEPLPSQLVQPSAMGAPPIQAAPHSIHSSSEIPYASRGISRRKVVLGLGITGLAVASGGIAWLVSSRRSLLLPVTPTSIPLGTKLYTYRGHMAPVTSLSWSPDGKWLASSSGYFYGQEFKDHSVQVLNAANGSHVFTYRGHAANVSAVAWSPDGKRIASGSQDQTVQVWDATDGGNVFTYHGHRGLVNAVAWSPDGKHIASGSLDDTVQVWDATDGGNVFTYHGHSADVYAVAWLPGGKRIASGSRDNTVQVWDATDGGNVFTYHGHSNYVVAVAWSPDGKRIASGSFDQTVQVWDAAGGGHAFTYRGHSGVAWGVAWSPDGKRIASGSNDHTVQVWDATDGGNVFPYHGHSDIVWTVAWSPGGKRIASGSSDTTVQVWEAQ